MEEMSELSQVCSKLLRLNGIGYKSRMEYEEAEQNFEEEIDDVLTSLLFVYNDMHPHDRTNENSLPPPRSNPHGTITVGASSN